MRKLLLGCGALVLFASTAPAQRQTFIRALEVRPFVGMYIPAGEMRDAFKTASTLGLQGAYQVNPNLHILATGGWTYGHNKFNVSDDVTHIWQYDVGAELGMVRPLNADWSFYPFFGLGAGGRTYDYAESDLATKSCTAGYAAAGTEFQTGPVGLRLEGRGYAVCFKSPVTGESKTRSDFGLALGAAFHF